MIGAIMSRKEILSQADAVLPVSNNQQYQQAIVFLSHSNDILQFEDDFNLSALVTRLHQSIDLYLAKLPEALEFERLCYEHEQNITDQAA